MFNKLVMNKIYANSNAHQVPAGYQSNMIKALEEVLKDLQEKIITR